MPASGPRELHYANVPRGNIADVARGDATAWDPRGPPPPTPTSRPVASNPQWWQQGDRRAPSAAAALPHEAHRQVKLRTLGILMNSNHPAKAFYEHRFLVWVKECLTTQWPLIQGGNDDEAGDNDEDQSDVEIGDAEDDSSSSSRVDDGDISIVF